MATRKKKSAEVIPAPEKKIKFRAVARPSAPRVPTFDELRQMYALPATMGRASADVRAAMDAAYASEVLPMVQSAYAILGGAAMPRFIGYPALAGLTQNGLIRAGVEMIADELTRKWVDIQTTGKGLEDGEQNPLIADLKSDMELFSLRKVFHDASTYDSYYGGGLVYIDTGEDDPAALVTPLYRRNDDGSYLFNFTPGTLKGFRLIEPFNVSPGFYNATNPLSPDYFKPRSFFVLGREIDVTRFLYFASRLPPTILLPTYNFFGIPLSQTVLDVVQHFTDCREAEARLLKKFSLTVFKTDMSDLLSGQEDTNIRARIDYFVQNQTNDGAMVIDKEEDILKVETPLGGVTDIVRQSMEMVAAYFGEPTVKLWGISPGGFNSTGEADLRNHYDHVAATQEKLFREPLNLALKILQYNRNGRIDDSIVASFVPIGDEDANQIASVNKQKADTASVYLQNGVLAPEEVRQMLVDDEQSGYTTIDVSAVPEDDTEGGGMMDMGGMMGGMPAESPENAPESPEVEQGEQVITETEESPK